MAINFSASFAACLAAGLKVPRQIMYCISQDTGAPYVLYKDSQDAAERGAALTAGQWGPDMYPGLQQGHPTHLPQAHNQTQLPPPQNTTQSPPNHQDGQQPPQQQSQQQNGSGHPGPSPATSPYPKSVAEHVSGFLIFKKFLVLKFLY